MISHEDSLRNELGRFVKGNKSALGNKAFTGRKHSLETIKKIKESNEPTTILINLSRHRIS